MSNAERRSKLDDILLEQSLARSFILDKQKRVEGHTMWNLRFLGAVLLLGVCRVEGQGFQLTFGAPPTQAPSGGFDPNCADKIPDCDLFGQESCGGQYADWARDNCALTCGYCTGPPTTPAPCVDMLPNCDSYEAGACSDPQYSAWAKANCRRTCRLCPADVLARLDAQTTTIPPEQCVDKLDCRPYGQASCSGDYEAWAKENCMNYCGFCVGVPTTPKPCLDTRPNCNQYEQSMCTDPDYSIWVDDNCAQYCGRCGPQVPPTPNQPGKRDASPELTPPPSNQMVPTAISGTSAATELPRNTPEVREDCANAVDNCREFGEAGCHGIYEPFARSHCAEYCGFCINPKATEPPCVDANAFCDRYGTDACTNPSYKFWAEDNCRKTCNLCNSTRITLGPATATDSPSGPGPATATDSPNGPAVPTASAQATTDSTTFLTPPVPVVTASSGRVVVEQTVTPTFMPASSSPAAPGAAAGGGMGEKNSTTAVGSVTTLVIQGPPPKESGKCLYHGVSYGEQEMWSDGCDYDCTCVDAAKNRMVCVQKCNQWTTDVDALLGCRLIQVSGECCSKLEC